MAGTFHCSLLRVLDYEQWANTEVADALAQSGFAADHRARKLFAHIAATYSLWLSRIGEAEAIAIWPNPAGVDAAAVLAAGYAKWREFFVRDGSFWDTPIRYTNTKGEAWSNTPRDMLAHIQLHSSYHRGQIAILFGNEKRTPAYTDFIEGARRGSF